MQQSFNQRSKEHFTYSGGPQRQLSLCPLVSASRISPHTSLMSAKHNRTNRTALFILPSVLGLSLNPGQCWAKGSPSSLCSLQASSTTAPCLSFPTTKMDRLIRGFLVGSQPEAGHRAGPDPDQALLAQQHLLTAPALIGPLPSKKLQITSIHAQAGAVSCSTGGRAVGRWGCTDHILQQRHREATTQQPTRLLGEHPTPAGAHAGMGMPS